MSGETTTPITELAAPFGQEIQLHDVALEDGVKMMRVRIRERSRFTVFDIDPATAKAWGNAMTAWAEATGTLTGMFEDTQND